MACARSAKRIMKLATLKRPSKATCVPDWIWTAQEIPIPTLEHRFHPVRKWRIDLSWLDKKLAVEIEGGVWGNGRHNRGKGFIGDMEKYNAMVEMGWKLLRYTPSAIDFDQIRRVLNEQRNV
jgi:hypothetical protein